MSDQSVVVTKPEREALKAIYRLSGGASEVQTGSLASALGLSPGTVSATLKRMGERGLLEHRPYRGATLTSAGSRAAVSAIRRHRIVERFLSDMLGYPWNEADRLAAAFEHDLPHELEERLFIALNRPDACPHGFPIPAREDAELPETPPLCDLEPGDRAIVAVPGSTDPDLVAFLETLDLRPGVAVEVQEKHPFDGPLVIVVNGKARIVGRRVAEQVFVRSRDRLTQGTAPAGGGHPR